MEPTGLPVGARTLQTDLPVGAFEKEAAQTFETASFFLLILPFIL
jgi:hypothetical protein